MSNYTKKLLAILSLAAQTTRVNSLDDKNTTSNFSNELVQTTDVATVIQPELEFGTADNIYSMEDQEQVLRNLEISINGAPDVNLKAAFAPGPTPWYDYKAQIWYNFKYKGVNLVASGLVFSDDRAPPHCEIYQPILHWEARDFKNICLKLRREMPDIKTRCEKVDTDRNGGTCNNYKALMSFENKGRPDVWVNQNTFSWKASNDPQQDCHLYTYHEYSTVVYACKNPVLMLDEKRHKDQYSFDNDMDQDHTMEFALRTGDPALAPLQSDDASTMDLSKYKLEVRDATELLDIILTHAGRGGLTEKIRTHGCWCPFLIDPVAAFSGQPLDEFDTLCRDHRTCHHCGTFYPAPCAQNLGVQDEQEAFRTYTVWYNNKDGSWECDAVQDGCQRSRCECDLNFALDMDQLVEEIGFQKTSNQLHEVFDDYECPRKRGAKVPLDMTLRSGARTLLPGEVYSPRGPAQPVEDAEHMFEDDKLFQDNLFQRSTGKGGGRIGKIDRCCGSAPTWRPYNSMTHFCSDESDVLERQLVT